MNESQRKEMKRKIEDSIHVTEAEIAELEELTRPISPENAIGRVSRMDAINNKSINEAALVQARTKLDRLRFALNKCDDPRFGLCQRCGREIPMGRLLIMPESLHCVQCATH